MTNWKSIPKTELHLHLEGAAPVDFITRQAAKKNLDLSHVIDGDHYKWGDFSEFLQAYEAVMSVLITPEDFADLTRAVLRHSAEQGVKYTEITLGPILMSDNDPARWNEMMAAIEAASDEIETEAGIVARYTAVIVRHFGEERGQETAELVAKQGSPRITGFGMAGDENFGMARDFQRSFEIADEVGLGLTCHAGEWRGPNDIRDTIDSLNVTRLGHGIRSVEDLDLINYIKDKDIHLEVNPGSNVSLRASGDWASHPIHQLRDLGVSVSISTDDPPYFQTTMEREYRELSDLGWSMKQLRHTNVEAMRHAFVDNETRAKLATIFEAAE